MNKKKIVIVLLLCVVLGGGAYLLFHRDHAEYVEQAEKEQVAWAYQLLSDAANSDIMYTDYLRKSSKPYGTGSATAQPKDGISETGYDQTMQVLDYNETAVYQIDAASAGWYYIKLEYKPVSDTLSDFNVSIAINKTQDYLEMKTIALPLIWSDETKDFPKDSYGDETAPKQVRKSDWGTTYLYNNSYSSALPLLFYLEQGSNQIEITNVSSNGLGLGKLFIEEPKTKLPTYAEYQAANAAKPGTLSKTLIELNATEYIEKNTLQIVYSSEDNPALKPHDTAYKKLNVLSWEAPGAELTYEIEVPEDGFYRLAFHYKNGKEEFDAFQTITIDGEIPFQECINYAFAPTGSTYANETFSASDGEPYLFYLTKGIHTLTLRCEQEPVVEAWRYARLISEHVTQFTLQITKITGANADANRTWKMTKYIPEIADYLKAYRILIQQIRYLLQDYATNGINGALLSDLDKAMQYIEKMSEYPDEIALYTEELTGRDNSVLAAVSNFTTEITKQKFALDRIYVYGDQKLPDAKANVMANLNNWFSGLFHTFTSDKYKSTVKEEDVVTIWVNRALTHVDLLQKLADTEFTPRTGIKVKISAMPDANKLTMAAAADQTPDIALGLISHMPFDLACRGALYDLTQFEDFWQVAERFVPGAFVPYVYNEGVYAIPETLDFHALVYRKDIFESLGLTPPDTWQDVVDLLPSLQRYGMNFYHNIASGVGYKWFYQTSPLIFQNNGKLYSDDGLRTAIDDPNSVKGLQALGDLFIAYSLDTQVNSFFNSFRYSILPVGIIDSNEYILLKNGAPELEGQWALSAYPGTVQEDGSISRWYIANGTGGIIFGDTKYPKEAWEFLKWWTDHDTQVNYTYTLRSTYGNQFFWLPSNVEAVEDAPIEQADKMVILEQIKWLRDVPRTPGQYLLERSISDIWNTMVFDGVSAQVAVDEKTIAINREIKKKMKELGFYDEEGNLIKSYAIRDVDWITEQIERAKEGNLK